MHIPHVYIVRKVRSPRAVSRLNTSITIPMFMRLCDVRSKCAGVSLWNSRVPKCCMSHSWISRIVVQHTACANAGSRPGCRYCCHDSSKPAGSRMCQRR